MACSVVDNAEHCRFATHQNQGRIFVRICSTFCRVGGGSDHSDKGGVAKACIRPTRPSLVFRGSQHRRIVAFQVRSARVPQFPLWLRSLWRSWLTGVQVPGLLRGTACLERVS